jgi:hypothetical protein
MARFRFFSDTSQRLMLYQFPDLSFDGENCAELETPDQFEAAYGLGAAEEPVAVDPRSTIGVNAFTDMAAFGARSRADLMPGYVPPPVTTVFGVKRRTTRRQP